MKWYNITAATSKSRCDELERLFWSLGALSVTVADGSDDPIFEPGYGETPLWCDIHMTSLFPDSVDISQVDSELRGNSYTVCLLYTSPSPRDVEESRMPSSA